MHVSALPASKSVNLNGIAPEIFHDTCLDQSQSKNSTKTCSRLLLGDCGAKIPDLSLSPEDRRRESVPTPLEGLFLLTDVRLLIHLRIRVGLIRAFSWTLFSVGVIFPLSRISSSYSLKNLCKIPPDKWLEDRLAGIAKDQDQIGVQHFHIFPFHQFTSNPNSINTMRNVCVFFYVAVWFLPSSLMCCVVAPLQSACVWYIVTLLWCRGDGEEF